MVQRLIARADETAPLDDVVPVVEGRRGEVLIDRVDFKPLERVDRGDGVLPDVAYNVVEAVCVEHVHWVWGQPVLQINVTHLLVLPAVQVLAQHIPQRKVLILRGQPDIFPRLLTLPAAKRLRLQIVHLHRPVPRHLNHLRDSPQVKVRLRLFRIVPPNLPKQRLAGLGGLQPILSLFSPVLQLAVPVVDPEVVKLPVGDQHLARLELLHLDMLVPELVVPAVGLGGLLLSVPLLFERLDRLQNVRGNFAQLLDRVRTLPEPLRRLDLLNRQAPDDDRRRLQMDPLVLDAHQNDPHVAVPGDLLLLSLLDQADHQLPHPVPVQLGLLHRRPVVVRLAQVVPVHLVHPHREHSLIRLVDPLPDQPLVHQLVHEKRRRVPVVKDQGVAQGLGFGVVRTVALDHREQLLVQVECAHKIFEKLLLQSGQLNPALERLEGKTFLQVIEGAFRLHMEINNCLWEIKTLVIQSLEILIKRRIRKITPKPSISSNILIHPKKHPPPMKLQFSRILGTFLRPSAKDCPGRTGNMLVKQQCYNYWQFGVIF